MQSGLTDTLCTQCGLCCDGTLFADVELAGRAEPTRLEVLGLDVVDDGADGAVLQQPCAALKDRRCSVYAHRPGCCRTFECQLLQGVRNGAVDVDRAAVRITRTLEQIRRVEQLLGPAGPHDERLPLRERCAERLAGDASSDPGVKRRHAELSSAMSTVERTIRKTFLP